MNGKTCSSCYVHQPVTNYRLRSKTGSATRSVCHDCHAARERLRKSLARSNAREKSVRQFWQQLGNARNSRRVEALVASVVDELGGVDRVARVWAGLIDQALAQGKHAVASRALLAIARLGGMQSQR